MSAKIVLLFVGLVVGALAGYLTRPEAAEIKIGSFSVEVQSASPAGTRGGSLTSGQMQHLSTFAVIGAVLGFGAAFVADRRRD